MGWESKAVILSFTTWISFEKYIFNDHALCIIYMCNSKNTLNYDKSFKKYFNKIIFLKIWSQK